MSDLDWLKARGFVHVGHWMQPGLRLQRVVKLHREPGVYAFVVAGDVRYLGKATSVRSRLRGYNRATDPTHPRPPRAVHTAIHQAWRAGDCIQVWFRRVTEGEGAPGVFEARWIAELQPPWNVAGVSAVREGL